LGRLGPQWDERPYRLWLRLQPVACEFNLKPDPFVDWVLITRRQYERCRSLQRQEQYGQANREFREELIAWLMRDYRALRRLRELPSIGPIIPAEDVELLGYGETEPMVLR
jgi:hypothetical protein